MISKFDILIKKFLNILEFPWESHDGYWKTFNLKEETKEEQFLSFFLNHKEFIGFSRKKTKKKSKSLFWFCVIRFFRSIKQIHWLWMRIFDEKLFFGLV